jgi:alpha-D-ribose 1-methylphosphonate 5-triphosphate diphosphatase PhnM
MIYLGTILGGLSLLATIAIAVRVWKREGVGDEQAIDARFRDIEKGLNDRISEIDRETIQRLARVEAQVIMLAALAGHSPDPKHQRRDYFFEKMAQNKSLTSNEVDEFVEILRKDKCSDDFKDRVVAEIILPQVERAYGIQQIL